MSQKITLFQALLKFSSLINWPMQHDVASQHKLTLNEVRVMMCIFGEGPLGVQAIADIMAMPPMNVSRSLSALHERGWTDPVPVPGNKRLRPMQLSAAGLSAYHEMLPTFEAISDTLFSGLDIERMSDLTGAVNSMIAQLEEWPGRGTGKVGSERRLSSQDQAPHPDGTD